jgi:pyruvate dehydrogenase E2 component (dihydrolipoamide acetyltransferase)
MSAEIIMPKMGDAMMEGKVVRWYKKAGDAVKKGEPVLEIETDKVNLDLEAEADGIIEDVKVSEGEIAPVGATLATIAGGAAKGASAPKKSEPAAEKAADKPAEKTASEKPAAKSQPGKEEAARPVESKPVVVAAAPAANVVSAGGHIKSSPLARKMARELGLDLGAINGSGPSGRVIAADIAQASRGKSGRGELRAVPPLPPAKVEAPKLVRPAGIEAKQVPLTAMRRTIAKRLAESLGPVPHFFLTIDVDVTDLLALRKQLNEIAETKASVNDFVVRAAALALLHHPNVNSSWSDEAIIQHGEVSIGIAVATPEGLITPVVRNADQKSVSQIAGEVRTLADKAKNRKLKPDDYQGGTFTISNLGMFGIDEFTAIINPPNSAILAVGSASPQPVADANRQLVVRDRMKITMSCDHRVIDGAAGAQYLQTLRTYIEQPLRLVL